MTLIRFPERRARRASGRPRRTVRHGRTPANLLYGLAAFLLVDYLVQQPDAEFSDDDALVPLDAPGLRGSLAYKCPGCSNSWVDHGNAGDECLRCGDVGVRSRAA